MEKPTAIHKAGHNPFAPLVYIVYAAFLLVCCYYSYKKPAYNWDILPYMGVVLSYELPPSSVHEQVYAIAKEQVPRGAYALLTDSTHRHRGLMAKDPAEFTLHLPFYLVKPLYTRMAYLFYKAGVSLTRATVLPSLIAYFLICLLLLHWLLQYLPTVVAGLLGFLLAFWGPLLAASKLSTPDCLSAFLLFAALYGLVERKPVGLTYLFLLLSIFSRIDNILPAFFLLSLLLVARKPDPKISLTTYLLLVAGAVLCYLLICREVKAFGWHGAFSPTFYRHLNTTYDIHAPFSFAEYFALVKSQFLTGLYYSSIVLFAVLTVLYLIAPPAFSLSRPYREQTLVLLFWLLIAFRFILQPVMADRFYLPYYLCILVFLARKHLSVRRDKLLPPGP